MKLQHSSIMIKPTSKICPIQCTYCFYKDIFDKAKNVYRGFIDLKTTERIISQILECTTETCTICFQGGEPTLAGLQYFKEVVALQKKHNVNNVQIFNSLQTAGVLINDEWAQFLGENNFLVGISMDGPEYVHDKYRKGQTDSTGKMLGTFQEAKRGLERLRKNNVEFNVLVVVSDESAKYADEIYDFFQDEKIEFLQFIPAMDSGFEQTGKDEFSLLPDDYEVFLDKTFSKWAKDIRANKSISINIFEQMIEKLMGFEPSACYARGYCGMQNIYESDGSLYPCDFYVTPEYQIHDGNAIESYQEVMRNKTVKDFLSDHRDIPDECKACPWLQVCRVGGCKRYRNKTTDEQGKITYGKAYYCSTYTNFLNKNHKEMKEIGNILLARLQDVQAQ